MDFITNIDEEKIVNLIKGSSGTAYLCIPSIHISLSELIIAEIEDTNLHIIIDFTENKIRDGYGQFEAIEKLRKSGFEIETIEHNMVSFIIIDDCGYFLFPQSKIRREKAKCFNAVLMNTDTRVALIQYFYPDHPVQCEMVPISLTSIVENTTEKKCQASQISNDKFEVIKKNIENDPPLNPDLANITSVYTSKIQFIEFHFVCANIGMKKVNIPSKILPFRDQELINQLQTRLRLFENLQQYEGFRDFEKLKTKVLEFKQKYLISFAPRNKSIIEKNKNGEFMKGIEELNIELDGIKKQLKQDLLNEKLNTQERFAKTIYEFLLQNPTEALKSNIDNQALFLKCCENEAQKLIYKIKFPDVDKLVEDIVLNVYHYDVTYEDLNDDKFLELLMKQGVITKQDSSTIVESFKAVKLKKA